MGKKAIIVILLVLISYMLNLNLHNVCSTAPGSDDGMVLDDWMKYETDDKRSKGFVFILNNFTKEREGRI